MNCPDIEKIISFSMQTPQASEAELAAHIYQCKQCQEKFSLALDVVKCDYEITSADIDYANSLTIKRTDIAAVLSDIVNFISDKLKDIPMLSLSTIRLPHLQTSAITSFASGGKTKIHTAKKLPEIVFSSIESKLSSYYWRACFQLPQILHESSLIQIFVVDGNNSDIKEALLTIGGVTIKICNGKAQLNFKDFRKSTEGSEIELKFPDGNISPGVIELQ